MTEASGINLNTEAFNRQAKQFVQATGQDASILIKDVMRMLVETLYGWTAPPTKGNRGSRGGRAGGKAMVKDDIYKVAEGRELGYIYHLMDLYTDVDHGKIINIEANKKGGGKYRLNNVLIDTTGEHLSSYHRKKRNNRGLVQGKASSDGSNVSNKILTTYAHINKYLKEAQERVGKMKAGWAPALRAVGSKLPPAWVQTAGGMQGHFGAAKGSYNDSDLRPSDMSGSATALNNTPYARDNDGMQRRAEKQTERFLQKHGDKWLDRMVKKHNKAAA